MSKAKCIEELNQAGANVNRKWSLQECCFLVKSSRIQSGVGALAKDPWWSSRRCPRPS
jgi:hypothetical protein